MTRFPSSWAEVPLPLVCEKITDGTHHSPPNKQEGDFKYVTAKNIRPHGLDLEDITYVTKDVHDAIYARCPVEKDDVLYIKDGATTGLAICNPLDEPFSILSSVALLKPKRELLDANFLKYWLNSPGTLKMMLGQMSGSAIRRLTLSTISAQTIPLPPLSAQRRIVAKLDRLRARSSRARQELDHIPKLIERYKQAILARAFSGQLTEPAAERVRIQIPVEYELKVEAPLHWQRFTLNEICTIEGGSQPPKSTFKSNPADDLIRLVQIRDYKSDKNATYIPRQLARRFCSKTDIMIGRYGPPIFQILRGIEGAYNVALMKAVPNPTLVEPEFLYWLLQTPALFTYVEVESKRTAGQDGVNKSHLLKFPVFVPSKNEQLFIVRKIEIAMKWLETLTMERARASRLLPKLDQAVLTKAFRGELVPQDPNDEPASELLKRIKEEKEKGATTKARKCAQ